MSKRLSATRQTICLLAGGVFLATCGCKPLRNWAMNQVADVLADSSQTFHIDDDPDLVADALPFALKLIEGTLGERPHHRKLLLKACSGFTEYAYGFVAFEADVVEDEDFEEAEYQRERARRLFLRARKYGLRALEDRHPDFLKRLRQNPEATVAEVGPGDAAFLYWTAASWGAAIGVALDDPDLVADQPVIEVMFDRMLMLEEGFEDGGVHTAMIVVEMSRQGGEGKAADRAKPHYLRAVELSHGRQAAPHVTYAESVCVQTQDRDGFKMALEKALAVDVELAPERRTANLVMQRRARWLLEREDELFVRHDAVDSRDVLAKRNEIKEGSVQ